MLRNVWGLVFGLLANAALSVFLSYVFHSYRPRLAFDKIAFQRALNFGKFALVIAVASYVTTMADNVMVGRLLGTSALGNYALAYNVASVPIGVLVYALGRVLFPAYAEIAANRPQHLEQAFTKVFTISSLILISITVPMFPACRRDSAVAFRPQMGHGRIRAASFDFDYSAPWIGADSFDCLLWYEPAKAGGRGKNAGSDRLSGGPLSSDCCFRIDRRRVGRRDRLCVCLRKPRHGLRRRLSRASRQSSCEFHCPHWRRPGPGCSLRGVSLTFLSSPLPRVIMGGLLSTIIPALVLLLIRADLRKWIIDWSY